MIGEIVTMHTTIQGNKLILKIVPSIQNNQIKIYVTKDFGVINQISMTVSDTCNEKVSPFQLSCDQTNTKH